MARLELFVQWNIYDENGEILEIGDGVEASYNGVVTEGVIDDLFCLADEEVGYIRIEPYGDIDLETAIMFDDMLDVETFDYIKKISY